jgi:hypothetical protein
MLTRRLPRPANGMNQRFLEKTLIHSCPPYEPPIFRLTSAKILAILPVSLRFLPVSDEKSIVSSGERNESAFP